MFGMNFKSHQSTLVGAALAGFLRAAVAPIMPEAKLIYSHYPPNSSSCKYSSDFFVIILFQMTEVTEVDRDVLQCKSQAWGDVQVVPQQKKQQTVTDSLPPSASK